MTEEPVDRVDEPSPPVTRGSPGVQSGWSQKLFPAFAIFGSIGYFICMGFNFAPFAYYPLVGEFHVRLQPESLGPPMFWYGWIIYGALIGAIASALMMILPRGASRALVERLSWLVWAIPTVLVLAITYLLRGLLL